MQVNKIPIGLLNPAAYNPRKDLQPGDPEYEKLKRSMQEFGYVEPIVWNKRTGNIVGGHQRYKVLLDMGMSEVDCVVVDLDETKEKALNLALNKIQGDWDYPKLKDLLQELDTGEFDIELTGFDMVEIEDLMTQFYIPEEKKENKPKVEFKHDFTLEPEILEEIKQSRIFFTFSGGKDSSVTAYIMIPILKEMGKDFELIFVDTGVEIPSVSEYAVRFAEHYGAKLKIVKNGPDFFEYYEKKKRWPSAIFRDCIEALINTPADKYIFNKVGKDEKFIIIRGGRAKQTTNRSKGEKFYSLKQGKREIKLLNPLFDLSDEAFERYKRQLEEEFGLWEGYAKGFQRTACWCCPFQTKQQYETIKKELPFLWAVLERKAKEWEFQGETSLEKYIRG